LEHAMQSCLNSILWGQPTMSSACYQDMKNEICISHAVIDCSDNKIFRRTFYRSTPRTIICNTGSYTPYSNRVCPAFW
jgi:hypothetical protein